MVRTVAFMVWGLALAAFLAYLHALGRGPFASLAARHQREMKERTALPATIEPMTGAEFLALPRQRSVAEYSGIERRAVSLEGEVTEMIRATDGDYHLALRPPGDPNLWGSGLTAEVTPEWHRDAIGGWGYERLLSVLRPDVGGATPWPEGPARVRLSGWLLYDHESDVIARMLGIPLVPRATDWEIHPVTKIERWDDAHAGWVEVKR